MFQLLATFHTHAQSMYPQKPTLYSVTVDIESQFDIIIWYQSPSDFTDYYKVNISEIPGPDEPPAYVPLEPPVSYPDTTYTNYNTESYLHSVGYTVVAYNDLGGGPSTIFLSLFEDPDSTVFLETDFDSCQATISLEWNDYNKWRGNIAEYNLYRRLGAGIYMELASFSEGTNSYLLNNVQVNQHYDLFIEVVHNDGRRSTSNRVDNYTHMSQLPGFINADFATIGPGNKVNLSFTIDPSSDLTHFYLIRGESPTGQFTQIAEISSTDSKISYTDDASFTSGIYYYRLDVANNCEQVVAGSNLANNIILAGSLSNMNALLHWNEYYDWLGGVEQYRIIRFRGREDMIIDTLDMGNITNFTDDLSLLGNYEHPESSLICYEVEGTENPNPYGIQGRSLSNRICFSVRPDIRMPNAFIPNDAEPLNQVFEPVFSFEPEHYDMVIYNRLGTKIWEGSQAWDGRVNGNYVPEGVYLYYLKVYNYSTDIIELNGKVTVVYR
jgi:hypothetical protein